MTAGPAAVERRRGPDRRTRRVSLRYPERRRGFERRTSAHSGPIGAAYRRLLERHQRGPVVLGLLLGALVALEIADLLLTLRALSRGATEVNPLLAGLLSVSPVLAGAVKLSIAAAVATGLWLLRRYRRSLDAALLLTAGLAVLLGYHLIGPLLAG
jgi:hypothetical protein